MTHIEFNGQKVIASPYVDDQVEVKRSWKERLFEKPFKPFKKTKRVYQHKFISLELHGETSYLCSYKTYGLLVKECEGQAIYVNNFHPGNVKL